MDAEGVRRSRKSKHPAGCGSACLLLKIWGLELLFSLTLCSEELLGVLPESLQQESLGLPGRLLIPTGEKAQASLNPPSLPLGPSDSSDKASKCAGNEGKNCRELPYLGA